MKKINQLLRNETVSLEFCFYGKRFAIRCNIGEDFGEHNEIIIWKTNTFMNGWWYTEYMNYKRLAYTYFMINSTNEYMRIIQWDIYCKSRHPYYTEKYALSDDESKELAVSLIHCLKTIAQEKTVKKITMRVEESEYMQYFEKEGFVLTRRMKHPLREAGHS